MVEATDQQSEVASVAPVQILALGSGHGDDRIAWHVAERLQRDAQLNAAVHKVASPWSLIDYVHSARKVIILDGCRSGAPSGTLVRLGEQELENSPECHGASHGGSISESLRLARALDIPFGEVTILAVEIDQLSDAPEITDTARRAALRLEAEVRHLLSQWQGNE